MIRLQYTNQFISKELIKLPMSQVCVRAVSTVFANSAQFRITLFFGITRIKLTLLALVTTNVVYGTVMVCIVMDFHFQHSGMGSVLVQVVTV